MVEQEFSGFMRVPFGVSRDVPFWELLVHTSAVFVRVANKGVAGYGTWKKIRKMGDRRGCWRESVGERNAETRSVQRGTFPGGLRGCRRQVTNLATINYIICQILL